MFSPKKVYEYLFLYYNIIYEYEQNKYFNKGKFV